MNENVYGKKSYEFAIGSIKASGHPLLSDEQIRRIREADTETAEKLLSEYGYEQKKTAAESIETEMKRAIDFIRSVAPDEELAGALFFEEDALNMKLFLKSKLAGDKNNVLPLSKGSIDTDILRVCVEVEDYSMLGVAAEKYLNETIGETDPCKISCLADNAFYARAVNIAEKKHSAPLAEMLKQYAAGINLITQVRVKRLGIEQRDYYFLPCGEKIPDGTDSLKSAEEIYTETKRRMNGIVADLDYDDKMGPVARYFFGKKNEASELRLIFAEKTLKNAGGGLNG